MHVRFTRRGPDWRRWIVCLAIALIGATSASIFWHGEHAADQDCVVCHLRHHTVADLDGAPQIRPAGSPELIGPAPHVTRIFTDHGYQVPPRAPPA